MNWNLYGKRKSKQLASSANQPWDGITQERHSRFLLTRHLIKWMSIPALLVLSMFSYPASRYEPWFAALVIVAALVFIHQAVRSGEYSRAVALIAVVVALSPLFLVVKIFLVMGVVCIMTGAALFTVFRAHPVTV
ncbi:MAG TPA: hypothetical protein VKU19_19890 [Bryobacteraceae bacterium]|nr:hypothetical protein [Bryobacteraceae bacterium]